MENGNVGGNQEEHNGKIDGDLNKRWLHKTVILMSGVVSVICRTKSVWQW